MSDERQRRLERLAGAGDQEAKAQLLASVLRSGTHHLLTRKGSDLLVGKAAGAKLRKLHVAQADTPFCFYLCGRRPARKHPGLPGSVPALFWGAPDCLACVSMCLAMHYRRDLVKRGLTNNQWSPLPRGFLKAARKADWRTSKEALEFCAMYGEWQLRSPWFVNLVNAEGLRRCQPVYLAQITAEEKQEAAS